MYYVSSLPWFLLVVSVALVLVSLAGILVSFSGLHQTLFRCNLATFIFLIVLSGLLVFSGTSETGQSHWPRMQKCLRETEACQVQEIRETFAGCCQEPPTCSFSREDGDCVLWNNNVTQLCYRCISCHTFVVCTIELIWRRVHIAFNICMSFLFVVYMVQFYVYWRGTQQQPQQQLEEMLEMVPLTREPSSSHITTLTHRTLNLCD